MSFYDNWSYHRFSFMFGSGGWGEGCSAATPPLDVTKSYTDPLTLCYIDSTATLNERVGNRASLLDVKLTWCWPAASSLMWDTCSSASRCPLCCSSSSRKPAASSSYPDTVLSTTARISRAAVLSFSVMIPLRMSFFDMSPTRCSATGSMLSPRTKQSNTTTGSGRNWRGMIRAAVPLPAVGRATNRVRLETYTGIQKSLKTVQMFFLYHHVLFIYSFFNALVVVTFWMTNLPIYCNCAFIVIHLLLF